MAFFKEKGFLFASLLTFLFTSNALGVTRELCLEARGKQAIDTCSEILQATGSDLKLMRHLADVYIEEENFIEALKLLDQARKQYPNARRTSYKIKLTKSMQAEKLLFAEDEEGKSNREAAKKSGAKTKSKLNRLLCLRLKGERGLQACAKAVDDSTTDIELLGAYANLLDTAGKKSQASQLRARINIQEVLSKKKESPKITDRPKVMESPQIAENTPLHIKEASTPQKAQSKAPPSPPKQLSLADKLRQLKSLKDQDLIDEVEYAKRKTALMDKAFGRTPAGEVVVAETLPANASIEKYGEYHALVIGVQDYQFLTKLQMAKNDTQEVAELLKGEYRYNVTLLEDPTRREILLSLGKLRRTLTRNDNLLIYYAGHGWLDAEADTGYWMPVDAAEDNDIEWLSLNSVISATRAIPAKHIMIVADSCFSGKLTRGLQIKMHTSDHLSKMASRKARVVLTSGGLEPVLDAGGGDHSVFAAVFLTILRDNKGILDGTSLFSKLRRKVMLKANQTPEYSDIRKAGHEGGDFLFVRKISGNS